MLIRLQQLRSPDIETDPILFWMKYTDLYIVCVMSFLSLFNRNEIVVLLKTTIFYRLTSIYSSLNRDEEFCVGGDGGGRHCNRKTRLVKLRRFTTCCH